MLQTVEKPAYDIEETSITSVRQAKTNKVKSVNMVQSNISDTNNCRYIETKNYRNTTTDGVRLQHLPNNIYSSNFNVAQKSSFKHMTEELTGERILHILTNILKSHDIDHVTFQNSNHLLPNTIVDSINSFRMHKKANGKVELSEREVAEEFIKSDIGSEMLKTFLRLKSLDAEKYVSSKPNQTQVETITRKVLKRCWYYHVTPKDNAYYIFYVGLDPNKGGQGNGVSTIGINNVNLQNEYNRWSVGYTFITPNLTEAKGYRSKYGKNSQGENNAEILDVFIDSDQEKMFLDPDSHGLKIKKKILAFGYEGKLNIMALRTLAASAIKEGLINEMTPEIMKAFQQTYEKMLSE